MANGQPIGCTCTATCEILGYRSSDLSEIRVTFYAEKPYPEWESLTFGVTLSYTGNVIAGGMTRSFNNYVLYNSTEPEPGPFFKLAGVNAHGVFPAGFSLGTGATFCPGGTFKLIFSPCDGYIKYAQSASQRKCLHVCGVEFIYNDVPYYDFETTGDIWNDSVGGWQLGGDSEKTVPKGALKILSTGQYLKLNDKYLILK